MKVVTLNAEKGGVGKTTLSVHLAAGLAQRGKSVLLIDADPQGHATLSLGMKSEAGLYNLLVRPDDYTLTDVIRQVHPSVYASETPSGHLYLLPGNKETRTIPEHVDDADLLKEQLQLLEGVDVVVIDTPPTPGLLMALIYEATDAVIVPTQCEALSIAGLMATIQRAQKSEAKILGIAPNLFEKATELHRYNLKLLVEAAQQQQWRLWSPIPKATAWREASQAHRTVFNLLPKSKATEDAWKMVERVEEALSYA